MKNYEEMANDVFRRINDYEVKQKKKRKMLAAGFSSLLCVCVLTLTGFSLMRFMKNSSDPLIGETDSTDDASTIKPAQSPHFIRLSTSKDIYQSGEDVILIAHVGCSRRHQYDNETFKIVFSTPDGIFVTESNTYRLADYPGEKYYMSDSPILSVNSLWDQLPVQIEFSIPAELFSGLGEGSIRAEIIPESEAGDELPAYQGSVYFFSEKTEIAFSINGIEDAEYLLTGGTRNCVVEEFVEIE